MGLPICVHFKHVSPLFPPTLFGRKLYGEALCLKLVKITQNVNPWKVLHTLRLRLQYRGQFDPLPLVQVQTYLCAGRIPPYTCSLCQTECWCPLYRPLTSATESRGQSSRPVNQSREHTVSQAVSDNEDEDKDKDEHEDEDESVLLYTNLRVAECLPYAEFV